MHEKSCLSRDFRASNLRHEKRRSALFRANDREHRCTADRALTLHCGFPILHGDVLSALHLTFVFAFYAVIKLLCHNRVVSLHPFKINIYPQLEDILHATGILDNPVFASSVGFAQLASIRHRERKVWGHCPRAVPEARLQ